MSTFKKLLPTEVPDGPDKVGFSGISSECSDETIRGIFEVVGPLKALKITRNGNDDVYGNFVYEDGRLSLKALKVCDGLEVKGSIVKVWRFHDEEEAERSHKRQKISTSRFSERPEAGPLAVFSDELKRIMARDAENKPARELFVNNVPDNYNAEDLRAFLGEAMQQAKLAHYPGNPIINLRVNQRFCSIELRTIEETTLAMSLTNIIYKGCSLQVGRTKGGSGPFSGKTWEEVRGECTMGIAETIEAKYESIMQALRPLDVELATAVNTAGQFFKRSYTPFVCLNNMLIGEQVEDLDFYEFILQDVKSHAEQFGPVEEVYIPKLPDMGKVLLKFKDYLDAARFSSKIPESTYYGRPIGAVFITQERYEMIKKRNT